MALRLTTTTTMTRCGRHLLATRGSSSFRAATTTSQRTAWLSSVAAPATTAAPSVRDVTISFTLVDPSGARRKVPGLIGKTLYEICDMHDIDLGPCSTGAAWEQVRSDTWTEPMFGEGPSTGYDHVLLSGKGVDTAAPKTIVEERMLSHYWDDDELFPESRLASMITLTAQMDGMTVYVPDRLVDDIP